MSTMVKHLTLSNKVESKQKYVKKKSQEAIRLQI